MRLDQRTLGHAAHRVVPSLIVPLSVEVIAGDDVLKHDIVYRDGPVGHREHAGDALEGDTRNETADIHDTVVHLVGHDGTVGASGHHETRSGIVVGGKVDLPGAEGRFRHAVGIVRAVGDDPGLEGPGTVREDDLGFVLLENCIMLEMPVRIEEQHLDIVERRFVSDLGGDGTTGGDGLSLKHRPDGQCAGFGFRCGLGETVAGAGQDDCRCGSPSEK